MTIPLDSLYHYIDEQFDGNALIYRFYPHGSKNQSNLWPLRDLQPYDTIIKPIVICHDQEPLQFHWYTADAQQDYINRHFDPVLHDHIQSCNLDFDTWANIYKKKILLHSEINSDQVELYRQRFTTAYWWSHAVIARDWYRYAEIDPALVNRPRKIDYLFNVYCRAWTGSRRYRLQFLELLHHSDVCSSTRTRFNPYDNSVHYSKYTDTEFAFDTNSADANSSANYCASDVCTSLFDVVLETVADEKRIMLTEKILRPIACCQPFVLMAGPGSLKILRDYGFQTYSKWFDESYDDIADPQLRMQAIVRSMEKAKQNNIMKHADNIFAVAEYNKRYFFSREFLEHVTNELRTNLRAASHTAWSKRQLPQFNDEQLSAQVSTHDPVTVTMAQDLCKNYIPTNPLLWNQ